MESLPPDLPATPSERRDSKLIVLFMSALVVGALLVAWLRYGH